MAATQISLSGILDGTSCYCNISIDLLRREYNKAIFNYAISAGYTSNGYTQAGYERYTGNISISIDGITTVNTAFTAKALSEAWSGNGEHYAASGVIEVDLSSLNQLSAVIRLTYASSRDATPLSGSATRILDAFGGVIRLNINGDWKSAVPYIKVGGVWKQAIFYINKGGSYKIGI